MTRQHICTRGHEGKDVSKTKQYSERSNEEMYVQIQETRGPRIARTVDIRDTLRMHSLNQRDRYVLLVILRNFV